MSKSELKRIISECINDVVFTYNKKKSGITAEVKNSVPTFQVWHGSDIKEYADIDALMSDKFFSGKSIDDLAEIVDFALA